MFLQKRDPPHQGKQSRRPMIALIDPKGNNVHARLIAVP